MLDIFKSVQFLEKHAISEFCLSEELLMEHAAIAIKDEIVSRFCKADILIVCGGGNNGGDGLAVARILDRYGYKIKVLLASDPKSDLAKLQLDRVKKLKLNIVKKVEDCTVVIDAIFGSGLNRKLDQNSIDLIDSLNRLDAYKIACDIPSGIDIDGNFSTAFKADITVTFVASKLALYSDRAKDFVGEIVVSDLGIKRSKDLVNSDYKLLQKSDLMLPDRKNKNVHKGSFGHLAVVVGEKQGAGIIAALSAIKFGAGLVTAVTKEKIINLPFEIMQSNDIPQNINSVAIGMGIGDSFTDNQILDILDNRAAVVDADLLRDKIILDILDKELDLIITPHPKEFADLMTVCGFGNYSVDEIQQDRFNLAKLFSTKYKKCVLLLKGANTIIAQNGKIFINSFGSNALAKGGSGDVLSGMIGALLAQGFSPLDAAINGSLAHAVASQNFTKNPYAMTPSDLIELITTIER